MEELISITVDLIPKRTIKPLFEIQESLKSEIKNLKSRKKTLLTSLEIQTKQKKLNSIKYPNTLFKLYLLFKKIIYMITQFP